MIYKSGQSLLDLADEILTDGVNRSVIPQGFDLTLFSEKLNTLYQPQAEAKHVELEFILEPCNQIVPFSKNMLMQIAGNLISNAIKFTSAGGKVQVKLGMILRRSKVFLRIHVSDTGSGMDEKSIQRILLGKAETTPGTIGERGYGLGLSLVKHLVELRGGKIKISSIVDQGSVFVVTLPQYL
jgi:signal transduction histidine kinase